MEALIIGRGTLRDRLASALFTLCYNSGKINVPDEFRPQFAKIIESVNRPLDEDTDFGEFTGAVRRMRLKKADCIVWLIWRLHREAARRGA